MMKAYEKKIVNNDFGRRIRLEVLNLIDGADHPDIRLIRNSENGLNHMKTLFDCCAVNRKGLVSNLSR